MQDQPDYEIYKRITGLYDDWCGFVREDNQMYFKLPYPQRVPKLRQLLKYRVLRDIGDIDLFLKISSEIDAITGKKEDWDVKTAEWLKEQIEHLPYPKVTGNKMVIGLMVWGEYVEKMYRLFKCWQKGNLPQQHIPIIHLITTPHYACEIIEHETTKALKAAGAHFVFSMIQPTLIKGADKYWLIGAGASLHIAFAKHIGAALHQAFPDTIYSQGYFAQLEQLAENHSNILMTAHRCDEELLMHLLKPYIAHDAILVPPEDLTALSLNGIHLDYWHHIVNNSPNDGFIPMAHNILWETKDILTIATPHINPVYISAKNIQKIKNRYYVSLDSEIDLMIDQAGGEFYIPTAEDGLFYTELTDSSRLQIEDRYINMLNYPELMWNTVKERNNLKFFLKGGSARINNKLRRRANVMSDDAVRAHRDILHKLIQDADTHKEHREARLYKHTAKGAVAA